jgi:DNA-binding MarR family transcriptional regulator
LNRYILDSRFALPEVRILYELYHHKSLTARDLTTTLTIDKGYLSRILLQFEKKKLVSRKRSTEDGRSTYLSLTKTGKSEFEILNKATNNELMTMLEVLTEKECNKLVHCMAEIKTILSKTKSTLKG